MASRSTTTWLLVPLLALWSLQGTLVCLGSDGHVDIGGGDEDCCHEPSGRPGDDGHSTAVNGPDDCCIDIVIPTIDAYATARKAHDESSDGPSVDRIVAAEPLAILDTVADGLVRAGPGNLAGPPPRTVRTVVLLL
ncbi:MAG: hypothetical protein ISS78_06265 [Phycisphaerae bacterium]|nr:hypothetical protein [Phycisphaerae bacterium]